ncbi:MAG: 16S rRNA (guanine(966)-N(2))-methyltransferase RsmD [Candidatus Omnitrophica bacterium]|nr:16S rRNA (guanine(966)-N(2))-methyltransferase RsmD [Candidatus Omnitrophota bacterium]
MRIITGKYRNMVIHMPKGIRPTQNKVRKAIFDILGDMEGLTFLELFAGTGAVGFEAASRGAKHVTLVEFNKESLRSIKRNILSLKLQNCDLYPMDTQKTIEILRKEKRQFDIIFFDPPYYEGLAKKTLQMLGPCDILAPNGFIVAQHFKKDQLPKEDGELVLIKEAVYGDTVLSFYRKA